MSKYPIFLELRDRRVVIVGAGHVAARKAQALLDAHARLVIIADHIDDSLTEICEHTRTEVINDKYSSEYLGNAALVIAATNDDKVNRQVYEDCQKLGILCNVVDFPELCDFFAPAVVNRGDLSIAICTEGNCPAYSGHIRKKLEEIFTEDHGRFLKELEELRKKIIIDIHDSNERKTLLGDLVSDKSFKFFLDNGPEKWHTWAMEMITAASTD